MDSGDKLYNFDRRQWTWEELTAHLDKAEREAFVKGKGRVFRTLPMISGTDILDVGCNAGILSHYLALKGHRVVGIEINPELVEICRRRYPDHPRLNFLVNGPEALEFPENSFDCAVALEVLEHVRQPWTFLSELARVLRPGGGLVISVPNAASLRVLLKSALINMPRRFGEMDGWSDYFSDQRDHVYLWDIFTLYRLLSLKGFRYRTHDFADSNPFFNFMARILPPIRRFSSSFLIKVDLEK